MADTTRSGLGLGATVNVSPCVCVIPLPLAVTVKGCVPTVAVGAALMTSGVLVVGVTGFTPQ